LAEYGVNKLNEKIKRIYIDKMTCVNCQTKIEAALLNVEGVLEAQVSYNEGSAIVAYDADATDCEKINATIAKLGYEPKSEADKTGKAKIPKWASVLRVVVVLLGGFFIFNQLGLFDFVVIFPTADENMALGALFVLGLLTSAHCVAMCGGINISQCAKGPKTEDEPPVKKGAPETAPQAAQNTVRNLTAQKFAPIEAAVRPPPPKPLAANQPRSSFKPLARSRPQSALLMLNQPQALQNAAQENSAPAAAALAPPQARPKPFAKKINALTFRASLLYNLGRVISYTAVGFIAGALGSALTFSDTGRGIVALIAAAFMIIMGLNMLGLFPSLRRITPRMPKFIASRLNRQKEKSNSPLIVGLLNGLMPCGPLQTMQLYALSTGSPFLGALSMLLFSLGTVPLMFFVGALSSILTKKFTKQLMTASAVLIIVMGMFMFNSGAALSGLPLPGYFGGAGPTAEATVDYANGVQRVSFDLKVSRYAVIKVKAGIPVVWVISAEEGILNGCNDELRIKEWNISKKLVAGDNTIEFTPQKSGTFAYSCSMGMIRSKIIVSV
jgi:sulfite exporter TauE/SafE/copper chaperone CopZ